MDISNLAKNLRGPWMIEPQQASVMLPILKGVLTGLQTESDNKQVPFMYSKAAEADGTGVSPKGNVYVTYISGTMMKHTTECQTGMKEIAKGIMEADADESVMGHIIIAESGGGATNSVPVIADAIKACTKPVVAWVDGLAASACLYAISYADRIIAAHEMDQIGCIGVMIELEGMAKYHTDKDGVISARIYADESFEKNGDYEAALAGDATVIREWILNPLAEQFMNDMKANRPNVQEDQLHGRTFFAKDVVGSLIDGIGDFDAAVQAVIELANKPINKGQMDKYAKLNGIASLSGLVLGEDGSATLQDFQLADIEAALTGNSAEADALRDQVASLTADHAAALAERDQQITTLTDQVAEAKAQHDTDAARIQELEAALAKAIEAPESDDANLQIKRDPGAAEADGYNPAKSWQEAQAACESFIENHK